MNNKVGSRTTELTLVDCPTVDDPIPTRDLLKSSGRLKQEVKTTQITGFRGFLYMVIHAIYSELIYKNANANKQ